MSKKAIKNKRSKVSIKKGIFIATLAMAGLIFSAIVSVSTNSFAASSPISYTTVPLTPPEVEKWTPDRTAPTGGYGWVSSYGNRINILEMKLAGSLMSNDNFHKTEGLQRTIPSSDSIKADLYVDTDQWNGKTVRAGLWGVGTGKDGAISSYPIVEYSTDTSNQAGNPETVSGWRYWSVDHWMSATTSVNPGWNTLEITHDRGARTFVYRINGNIVGSVNDEGSKSLSAAILNSKNYGQDYAVHWNTFAYGNISNRPSSVSDCKDDNWRIMLDSNNNTFNNQGDCMQYAKSDS